MAGVIMKRFWQKQCGALDDYSCENLLRWLKHQLWNNLPTWHFWNFLFSSLPKGKTDCSSHQTYLLVCSVYWEGEVKAKTWYIPERSKQVWVLVNLCCKSKLFWSKFPAFYEVWDGGKIHWIDRLFLHSFNYLFIQLILCLWESGIFPPRQPASLCSCPPEEHHCF